MSLKNPAIRENKMINGTYWIKVYFMKIIFKHFFEKIQRNISGKKVIRDWFLSIVI